MRGEGRVDFLISPLLPCILFLGVLPSLSPVRFAPSLSLFLFLPVSLCESPTLLLPPSPSLHRPVSLARSLARLLPQWDTSLPNGVFGGTNTTCNIGYKRRYTLELARTGQNKWEEDCIRKMEVCARACVCMRVYALV